MIDGVFGCLLGERFLLLAGDMKIDGDGLLTYLGEGEELEAAVWLSGSLNVVLCDPPDTLPETLEFNIGSSQAPVRALLTDLNSVIRNKLASLPEKERASLLSFISVACAADDPDARLSRSLYTLQSALRERLPLASISREHPRVIAIESIWRIDRRHFYVRGWMRSEEMPIASLVVVSPEGHRVELSDRMFKHRRPDIDEFFEAHPTVFPEQAGFVSFFETPSACPLEEGWSVELVDTAGEGVEVAGLEVERDQGAALGSILSDLRHDPPPSEELLAGHIHPVISRLLATNGKDVDVEIRHFGTTPKNPDTSIVVSLGRNLSLAEQQIAQFVRDPDMTTTEIVYLLRYPELQTRLTRMGDQLLSLYGVPFTVAIPSENVAIVQSRRLGAAAARGRLLLFMEPEVIPARPGWLRDMVEFHLSRPSPGATGPKLLHEDDSLAHSGIGFEFSRMDGWEQCHYFRGLDRSFPPAGEVRSVPVVSGACLMVSQEAFEEVGGFTDNYVDGGYEAADLCLRLAEADRQNWYLPAVELYHLEALAPSMTMPRLAQRYNAWVFGSLWHPVLEQLSDMTDASLARDFWNSRS